MLKPEEVDSCVKIGRRYIPAVNIQVEGYPGFYTYDDGRSEWYGLYFEVLFETGALWVVGQGSNYVDGVEYDSKIRITEYPKFGMTDSLDYPGATVELETWEEFLGLYDEKRMSNGKVC